MKIPGLSPFFLIIPSFLLFSFIGNPHKNDLTKENLKGKVRILKESEYPVKIDSAVIKNGGLESVDIFTYNKSGNQVEEKMNYYDGVNWDWVLSSKYNDKGYKIEDKKTCVNNTGSDKFTTYMKDANWKRSYVYNNKGEVIDPGSASKYDAKGNMVENIYGDEDGEHKFTWKYDNSGNVTQENEYMADDTIPSSKCIYTYDSIGNNIEKDEYTSDGRLNRKWLYKYEDLDKEGNWLKQTEYFNDNIYTVRKRAIEYYQ